MKKISVAVGETMVRITPPEGFSAAYCQTGVVVEVTDLVIALDVQVDVIRRMLFDRVTGFDRAGLGSFVVRQDWMA